MTITEGKTRWKIRAPKNPPTNARVPKNDRPGRSRPGFVSTMAPPTRNESGEMNQAVPVPGGTHRRTRASLRRDAALNAPDGPPRILRTDANEGAFFRVVALSVHAPRQTALMAPHRMAQQVLRLVDVFGSGEASALRRTMDQTRRAVSHRRYPTEGVARQSGPGGMKARETTESSW